MINRIKIIAVVCALLLCFSLHAEDKNSQPSNHALGLSLGSVVGNGLLYRANSDKHYYQMTFAGYVDKDEEEEYVDFSLSYGKYLKIIDSKTLGYPVGIKWISGIEAVYDQYEEKSDNHYNIGAGLGIDLGSVKRNGILLSLDLIYTATFNGLKKAEFNSLWLKPAVGLIYNF